MEKIGWTYLSAIASLTLGWFLNELGQWFRTRKEDKKLIKKTLYNLLEIHFTLYHFDTSEIQQLFVDRIIIRIPDHEKTDELKQFLNRTYSSLISGFIRNDIVNRLEKIEMNYTKAVDDLATIDPIAAYRLNGKTQIFKAFDLLQDCFNDFVDQNSEQKEEIQKQVTSTIEFLKPEIFKEAIKDLEIEIRSLAWSINCWTFYKTKKTLNRTRDRIKNDGTKKIDELLDKLIPK
jgi:hypothetical protein